MDLLSDLYKKYTQNHISNFLVITLICLGYLFLAPSQGCPVDWDCNAYIQMLDSLAYDPALLPHHAMRILPALIVRGFVHILGLSIEQGFNLLSGLSYFLFSMGFYFLLNTNTKPHTKIFTLGMTLLAMGSHHAVIQALVNVYQSTDALTYPIVLGLFYFTYYQKQFHWVFILTLIGLITRQNLFFMGELCLIFGLISHKKKANLLYIILAGIAYQLLVSYYHAGDILLASITPVPYFFTPEHILYVIQDSGLLNLIIPIMPIALWVTKDLLIFYFKNWYMLLYAGITVGQPFLSYHLTGNNFERIAMQGIWPLYLITGMLFYEKYLKNNTNPLMCFLLLFYSGSLLWMMKFIPVVAEPLRLGLSVFLGLLLLSAFLAMRKQKHSNYHIKKDATN